MKLQRSICPICRKKNDVSIIYKTNLPETMNLSRIFSARRMPDRIHYQIVRCNNDGLIRSDPILPLSTIKKLYGKSIFTYENDIENLKETYKRMVLPVLQNLSRNAWICEIGCGNGFFLELLQSMGFSRLYGIEPSSDAVKKASKHIRTSIRQTVLKDKLYKPNTFDLVFFFQTLDHIPHPNTFLQTCWKILKPGGTLIALTHDGESFSAKLLGEKSPIVDIEHTYLYSSRTLSLIIRKNGFIVNTIQKPWSRISMRYFLWLLPLPQRSKKVIVYTKSHIIQWILGINFWLPLGNVCAFATKPRK